MDTGHGDGGAGNRDQWLWKEYYQAFPPFSEDTVREGCHPRRMLHPSAVRRAVVLVHGLTDSPYFMTAIGEYFHTVLGYDVYLPLLQCHGLKSPNGMAGVTLTEWQKNLHFAVNSAAQRGARVSIGGLSTGGALCFLLACTDPTIGGDLYLFSPALGLSTGPWGIPGWFKEGLLRLPFVGKLDSDCPLVGGNPYRYQRVSLNSAVELGKLMRQIRKMSNRLVEGDAAARRIFAAWSECDTIISVDRLRELQRQLPDSRFVPFIISAHDQVEHACVVLEEPIYPLDAQPGSPPLERANPRFAEMLAALAGFAGPA